MSQSQWAFRSGQKLKDVLWGMDYQDWKKLKCPSYLSPEKKKKKTSPKSPISLVAEPRLELRSLTASDPKLFLPPRGRCVVETTQREEGSRQHIVAVFMKNSHWDSELSRGQREAHTHTCSWTPGFQANQGRKGGVLSAVWAGHSWTMGGHESRLLKKNSTDIELNTWVWILGQLLANSGKLFKLSESVLPSVKCG